MKYIKSTVLNELMYVYFAKFLSIFLSFVQVALVYNFLDEKLYGLWVTLISVVAWMSISELGIGNGIRNNLVKGIEQNDNNQIREYISTATILLVIISGVLIVVLIPFLFILDLNSILNVSNYISITNIRVSLFFIVFFYFINLPFSVNYSVFYAFNKASYVGFLQAMHNFLLIISILFFLEGSLNRILLMSIVFGVTNLLSNLFYTYYFYRNHREIIPRIKNFSFKKVKDISQISYMFFIIQLSGIVILSTDNFMIARFVGIESVSQYNLIIKILSVLVTIHSLLMSVLWSKFTRMYINQNILWLKETLLKLVLLLVPIGIVIIFFNLYYNEIISIWLQKEIQYDSFLVFIISIYIFQQIWNNIFSFFLNGIGEIKITYYLSVFNIFMNLPLAYFLAVNLNLGLYGILGSNIICLLFSSIITPIKVSQLLARNT